MSDEPQATKSKHSDAQKAYYQRQRSKGLVRLSVYVPEAAKEEFFGALEGLRVSWQRRGLTD
jgi:hypothetical protein